MRRPTRADAARAEDRRELRVHWGDDGMLVIRGRLTAEQGVLFLKALGAGKDDLMLSTPRGASADGPDGNASRGSADAMARRRADALALVADKSLTVAAGRSQADRTQVVVHVDAEVLTRQLTEGRGEVGGVGLSAESLERLSCDCVAVLMAHGETPNDVSVGRKQRIVPAPLRRMLSERQGHHCAFPGCTYSIDGDHHARHWAQGGATDADNCAGLCDLHHRLCHEGGFRMKIEDGHAHFTDPRGRKVDEIPPNREPRSQVIEALLMTQMGDVDRWTLAGVA